MRGGGGECVRGGGGGAGEGTKYGSQRCLVKRH